MTKRPEWHQDYGEAIDAAKKEVVFERQTMSKPVPIRWTVMDGEVHLEGVCCSPTGHGGSRCPKDGGRVHKQAVYGGIAYCCERCEDDAHHWQTGPLPESESARMQRELAEQDTISPEAARDLLKEPEPAIERRVLTPEKEQKLREALANLDLLLGAALAGTGYIRNNDTFDLEGAAEKYYIPGRYEGRLNLQRIVDPPYLAFRPTPMTLDEKIALLAEGIQVMPMHDACLLGRPRACRACMLEHDPGDEDADH